MPIPGAIWTEGSYFHFIDADGNEFSVQGVLVGPARDLAQPGEVAYISSTGALHYIGIVREPQQGARLYEYKLAYETGFSGAQTPGTGIIGSIWAEAGGFLHWLTTGKTEARTYTGIIVPEDAPYPVPPNNVPNVTLEAWYRPSSIVDGSDWQDDSGNAHHMTQGTPALELSVDSNEIDGYDTMYLENSTTKRLLCSSFNWKTSTSRAGAAAWVVWKVDSVDHDSDSYLGASGEMPGVRYWGSEPVVSLKAVLIPESDHASLVYDAYQLTEMWAQEIPGIASGTVGWYPQANTPYGRFSHSGGGHYDSFDVTYFGYNFPGNVAELCLFKDSHPYGTSMYGLRQYFADKYPSLTIPQPTDQVAISSFPELEAHWEAENATYDGSNFISSITDSSGNGHTASQSNADNKPKYVSSGTYWGAKPAVASRNQVTSGDGSFMSFTQINWTSSLTDFTVIAVVAIAHDTDPEGGNYYLYDNAGTGTINQLRLDPTIGAFKAAWFSWNTTLCTQRAYTSGMPLVIGFTYNYDVSNATCDFYMNGLPSGRLNAIADGNATYEMTDQGFDTIFGESGGGGTNGPTDYLMECGEIALIKKALTPQEHMNVAWKLLNDYDIGSQS